MEGMPWGGSEELWSQAARVLQARGHEVHVSYRKRRPTPPRIAELANDGAVVHWRKPRMLSGRSVQRLLMRLKLEHAPHVSWLSASRPDFVLINVGYHLDNLTVAHACQKFGIPYAILVQAAGYPSWVHASVVDVFRKSYLGAEACFFVSQENREIVETNLGMRLENARIVDNPVNLRADAIIPWPEADPWKIACIGRLHFQSKGQDLLVKVLQAPKWKRRPVTFHLWGEDDGSERQLRDLISLFDLEDKIVLEGFSPDVADVWATHHAMCLPSRYEGNSLAVVESLQCGRTPIVTDVGRNSELIVDNQTGFVAAAPVASLFDDALERAWVRRHEWREIGQRAKQKFQAVYSTNPPGDFATALERAADSPSLLPAVRKAA
jgi:glycosyltransferase involved in cell wall biosynthesis